MRDLYIALSGAIAQEKNLTVTANNLANVNTVGFKLDRPVFQSFLPQVKSRIIEGSVDSKVGLPSVDATPFGDRVFADLAGGYVDHSQGALRETMNPFDLAIEGPGFFVVQTDDGEHYTRAGNFRLSRSGELVTAQGFMVQGQTGTIKLDSAKFSMDEGGTILVDGEPKGKIRVVQFDDNRVLDKVGKNLFALADKSASPRDAVVGDMRVRQNVLEYSNVNMVDEMVRMIRIQRTYEMTEKAIKTIDEAYRGPIQGLLR